MSNDKKTIQKAYAFSNSNFQVYLNILEILPEIPDEQLKTLLALSKFMQNAYPTIETIMTISGRSRASVFRDIKKLESLGIISVKRRFGMPSIYNFKRGITAMRPLEPEGVSNNDEGGITAMRQGGITAMRPNHIKEHINKYINGDFLKIDDEKSDEAIESRRQFVISLANKKPLE